MNVCLDTTTNRGCQIVKQTIMTFITTVSELRSQALSPPELECTWITVQVFCPSTASDTTTLLHRVQTTFTEPLCAGLYVYHGDAAEFCQLRQTDVI